MIDYLHDSISTRSSDWRVLSKRIHEFYLRDFSSIAELLKEYFPRSWQNRLQRDVSIVELISKTLATFYRTKPTRRFFTGDGGQLSEEQSSSLRRVYDALKLDRCMKSVNEITAVQKTCVAVLLPKPGDAERKFIWKTFAPWEIEVDPDPIDNQSVSSAKEFRFRVPVSATHGRVRFGRLVMNSERIYYEVGNKKTGVFTEDLSNPFPGGRYPIWVCRFSTPPAGDFFCSIPSDIADMQIASSIALSDIDFVSRFSAHGQRVLKNADVNSAEAIQFGVDSVVGLQDDQELSWLTTNNDSSSYVESVELHMKHFSNCSGLSPGIFLNKGWATGLSKALDLHERDGFRQDHRLALQDAEQGMFNALRLVLNWRAGGERWPSGFVEVFHHEPPVPSDPFARAQSRRYSMEDGLVSPSEVIAQDRMIPQDEAKKTLDRNLAEYAEVRARMRPEESPGG